MNNKTAVVFDWLITRGGGEAVLEEVLGLFPGADLFVLMDFLPESQRGFLAGRTIRTTFFQKLPFARRFYRNLFPLMPLAVESMDLRGYDRVISLSHAVAKGVLTGPDQVHASYIFSPMRYAWDLRPSYLQETNNHRGLRGFLAQGFLNRMRVWDAATSNGVDVLATLSGYVARRIRKCYGREALVIPPPVRLTEFPLHLEKEDYYITLSRLVPYKRVDALVEAFRELPRHRLVMIGDGPEMKKIRARAGDNVDIKGRLPQSDVIGLLQRARAFLFAAEEDFGIAPLEAQACGTPVIAYGRGGARETIRGLNETDPTGLFFDEQTPAAIAEAVRCFERERGRFSPVSCRKNAERFSPERFREEFMRFVRTADVVRGAGAR